MIRSYVERVKQVNPLINAVVEDRFEAAIQDAKNVDLEVEAAHQHGTVHELAIQKPLLGVPLTVKESCCVKGTNYTYKYQLDSDLYSAFGFWTELSWLI